MVRIIRCKNTKDLDDSDNKKNKLILQNTFRYQGRTSMVGHFLACIP